MNKKNRQDFFAAKQVKFETEARILAMRLAGRGCWRPCRLKKSCLFLVMLILGESTYKRLVFLVGFVLPPI